MKHTPKLITNALSSKSLSWATISQAFSSEKRYQVFQSALAEMLAAQSVSFIPESGQPDFLERNANKKSAAVAGDPLSVYWTDLGKLRPTSRIEEFILGRSVHLLRKVILNIICDNPTAAVIAVAQEHLSSYSEVLAKLKKRNITALSGRRTKRGAIALIQQRLRELNNLQTALIDRNLHLVPVLAAKYRGVGVAYEDLIQEGNTSLLRAVERFDHTQNVRFASYANWWISQGILHALSFQSRTVRLPVYLVQALNRVRNVQAGSPGQIDIEEIAEQTQLTNERVERALRADCSCISIHANRDNNDEYSLSELLESPHEAQPIGEPSHESLRQSLGHVLDRLPSREAYVLRLRFGLDGHDVHTLEEVRQELNVSRERVRQLQAQALRRLNQPTPKKELAKFA